MAIQLYNTLTRKVEPFETIEHGVVRMYVCGVTVYDDAHIGHAMSVVVFDIIRRYFQWRGYKVIHVVNFTDIDDKIIERAQETGQEPIAMAQHYINEFLFQLDQLNVLPATAFPRATDTIQDIVHFIQRLIDKDYAYPTEEGNVYFRVKHFKEYGKLSGRSLDDMQSGTRVDVDEHKEAPNDFALWKAVKPGEPSWPSPWGEGRPGWHIECSAMNMKHLGERIDIHGGGNDLIFPHHENEIAQTEALTNCTFATYWIHNGMLQLVNTQTGQVEKMSKSLGNLVTIKNFLDQYDADVFRLIVLNSNYRSPLTYNADIASGSARRLERLRGALVPPVGQKTFGDEVLDLMEIHSTARERFTEAMDNDFNTSGALAVLFELVRAINVARDAGVGGAPFIEAQDTLRELGNVLGLHLKEPKVERQEASPFVDLLLEVRTDLRKAKQFELADKIRERLTSLGVTIEDAPQGVRWHW